MAGNYDGTLKFGTAIDQSGFSAGIDKLGSIAKSGMAVVGGAVAAVGAGMAVLGGYAVSVGSGFESSMSQVIATMGITRDTIQDGVNSFDLLSDAAKAAGESTTFSASEAADALNYLALAGYSAEQAADALPAVLDLAAAGGMELARASDLATDAMAALGIEANKENLTHFGDQLAKTASKANTNVAQLGEAILTVGGTAKSLKGGTVELNAALGVLANRGIKGAEGGTKLRNMILSLSAPTDVAKARLDALGVSTLDAEGNLRGLNEIFGDLDKSLTGMTDAQKTSILNEIFNKTDIAAAQGMLAGYSDEFDDLTAAIGECDGAMSDMAKTMNDNLEGDIKSLQSKAEALGNTIYDSMTAPLRSLVQDAGSYISQVKEAYEKADIGEGDLAGVASGMWSALGSNIVTGITDGIREHAGEIADTLILTLIRLPDAAADIVPELMEAGESLLTGLTDGMERRANLAAFVGQTLMERVIPAVTDNLGGMLEAGAELIRMLLTGARNAIPKLLTIAKTILQTVTSAITGNLPDLLVLGGEIIGALVFGLIDMLPDLIDVAVQLITMLAGFLADNLDPLLSAAAEIITALGEALLDPGTLASIIEAAGKLVVALVEGLTGDGMAQLLDAVLMLNTAILEVLLDPQFLGQMAETGASLLAELIKGLCQLAPMLVGEIILLMEAIGQTLLDTDFEGLGAVILQGIENGVNSIDFTAFWGDWFAGFSDIRNFFSEVWDNFKIGWEDVYGKVKGLFKVDNFLDLGRNIITGIWNGIDNAKQWMIDQFTGLKDSVLNGLKSVFGIASPSKLMEDMIGKNLALGIGVGFTAEMPEIGEDAVQAAKDAFTLPKIEPELLMPELPELGKPVISDIPELSAVIRPELLMPELPELSVAIHPEFTDFQEMPELPMAGGMLQAEIDPAALRLIEAAASMPVPVQAPAEQQIINNSYAYSSTTNNTQATEPQPQQSGDIIVPVYLGNDTLVTAVVKALQIANAQSGGVTI